MKHDENKLQTAVRRVLENKYRCMTEKLHGGFYQSGLPDLLVTTADGCQFWIEFKAKSNEAAGDAFDFTLDMLRSGRQKSICVRWAMRGVPVFACGPHWYADLRSVTPQTLNGFTHNFTHVEELVDALYAQGKSRRTA